MKYNSFSFRGRAGRWEFFLAQIFPFALIVPFILGTGISKGMMSDIIVIILFIVIIVAVWVAIAASVRRLRDLGFRGWWAIPYYLFAPLRDIIVSLAKAGHTWIFWLWILLWLFLFAIFLFCPGNKGKNRYGLPPKPMPP